jgi:aminoglycoside phosphotransferase (APT) family kinase protein
VFVVTAQHGRCFVVKQARPGEQSALARETAVLEHVLAAGAGTRLARHLPIVAATDAASHTLVFETRAAVHDLAHRHRHSARGRFSRALAGDAGLMLARLHALAPDTLVDLPAVGIRGWGLRMHRLHLDELHTLSAAQIELVEVIQRSGELCDALDDLRGSPADDAVVHGDVRWENCIALPGARGTRRSRVALVDWELARSGDRCLDVGAFFAEYLLMWVRSVPLPAARDAGRLLAHARSPLARMRPALRTFWAGYGRASGWPDERAVLHRATRFAAVRLVEAAFEEAQMRQTLRSGTHVELQLAANILRDPGDAASRLLGIDARSAVAR